MTVVQRNCPLCQGAFQIDDSLAGQNVNCPLCQGVVTIPAFAPAAGPDLSMYPPGFLPPSSYSPPPAFSPPAYSPASYAPPSFAPPSQDLLPPGAGAGSTPYGSSPGFETPIPFSPPLYGSPAYGPPPGNESPPAGARQLSCPICTGLFQVTPDMAGMYLACPHCTSGVTIPALWGETHPTNFYPPGFAPGEAKLPGPAAAAKVDAKPKSPDAPIPRDFYPPSPSMSAPAPASSPASAPWLPPGAELIMPPEPRLKPRDAAATPSITRRPGPAIDSLLPPSAPAPSADSLLPPGVAPRSQVDSLLPPGMRPATADSLLPPGAAAPRADNLLPPVSAPAHAPAPGQQVPMPVPQPTLELDTKLAKKQTRTTGEAIVIPTAEGGFVSLREPVKTIGTGDDEIELKRLSPEEKVKRRRFRNMLVGGFCFVVLCVAMLILVYGRK